METQKWSDILLNFDTLREESDGEREKSVLP